MSPEGLMKPLTDSKALKKRLIYKSAQTKLTDGAEIPIIYPKVDKHAKNDNN